MQKTEKTKKIKGLTKALKLNKKGKEALKDKLPPKAEKPKVKKISEKELLTQQADLVHDIYLLLDIINDQKVSSGIRLNFIHSCTTCLALGHFNDAPFIKKCTYDDTHPLRVACLKLRNITIDTPIDNPTEFHEAHLTFKSTSTGKSMDANLTERPPIRPDSDFIDINGKATWYIKNLTDRHFLLSDIEVVIKRGKVEDLLHQKKSEELEKSRDLRVGLKGYEGRAPHLKRLTEAEYIDALVQENQSKKV